MPTIESKISTFINRAQTRCRDIAKQLIDAFDSSGYQSPDSKDLLIKLYEARAFMRLLNTSDRGGMTEKQLNNHIDFLTKWLKLNEVVFVSYSNLTTIIEESNSGNPSAFATQADLDQEANARAAADSSLSDRIDALALAMPDPATFFPAGFFANQNGSNAVVFDDDVRLHTHANKATLDAFTSDLLVLVNQLQSHYSSVNASNSLHVTTTERTSWNARITSAQLAALSTVYAPISHTQSGGTKHTVSQIDGLESIITALYSAIDAAAGDDGEDGREIELRLVGTVLEWRYLGDATWNSLGDLKGDQGDPFQINFKGQASARLSSAFDGEDENFCYLETDTGYLFYRKPSGGPATTSDGWEVGLKFLADAGWSPVLSVYEVSSTKAVFEIVDWVGGTGNKPVLDPGLSPPSPVRWFIGASGITLLLSSAVNIRGPKGAGHGPVIGASGTLAGRGAHDDKSEGFMYLRTDVAPATVYIKNSDASADWSPEYPWQGQQGEIGPIGSAGIQSAKVSLSSAQILTLFSAPIQLLPAPGAGKIIDLLSIMYVYKYQTAPYATNTTLDMLYSTATFYTQPSVIDGVVDRIKKSDPLSGFSPQDLSIIENQAIFLSVQTGNPTAGGGTLDVYLTYRILDI